MTTLISTEHGELINLDHIQVISTTAVNSAGELAMSTLFRTGATASFRTSPLVS